MKMWGAIWLMALFFLSSAPAASGKSTLQQIGEFAIPEANQGIGVDDTYFYAVDNRIIAKYDKKTGKLAGKWEGPGRANHPSRQRGGARWQDLLRSLELQ